MKRLLSLAVAVGAWLGLAGCTHNYAPLPTVDSLNVERYMGLWYEVARYENSFEKGCVGATAHYTPTLEKVIVVNRCYDAAGAQKDVAEGHAKIVEGSNNTKLKVTFFWPFYGDYWVIMLDKDYRYAVVGTPSRKFLWILSRTKVLDEADKREILQKLPQYGYDASKLYWTTLDGVTDPNAR